MAEKTSGKSKGKSRNQDRDQGRGQQKQNPEAKSQRSGGAKGGTNGTAGGSSGGSSSRSSGASSAGKSRNQAKRGTQQRGGNQAQGRGRQQSEDQQGRREQARDKDQPQGENNGGQGGGMLRQAGSTVAGGIKQHPVTAAALGAGLTLLAAQGLRMIVGNSGGASSGGDSEGEGEEQDRGESAEGSYEGEEGDEGEDDFLGSSEQEDEDGGDEQGGMASRLGRLGRSGLSAVRRGAGSGFERGRQFAAGGWHNHPLFMCAAAFAAGAAAGFILPKTRQEDRLMGKSSDKVAGRFKTAASEMFNQGRTVASRALNEAVNATKKEIEREGLSPDRLSKKVKRVVSHVREAVSNAVQEE